MVPTGLVWGRTNHEGWQGRHGTAATAYSAAGGVSPAPQKLQMKLAGGGQGGPIQNTQLFFHGGDKCRCQAAATGGRTWHSSSDGATQDT